MGRAFRASDLVPEGFVVEGADDHGGATRINGALRL